ncbi:MAG: universal stress protein [Candidatus Binatia bacterium]
MSEVKHIMVATDLSPRADRALLRAAQLATEQSAKLTVLHVVEDTLFQKGGGIAHQIVVGAKEVLEQKITALPLQPTKKVALRTLSGKPFVEIIRQARKEGADVVVLGAHGQHFWKDMFLGTTTEKVVRKGDRTILVVNRPTHSPYRRVLVPVDFSECSRSALILALQLAPEAEFHILHAYQGLFEGRLGMPGVLEKDIIRYRRQVANTARLNMTEFLQQVDFGKRPVKHTLRHGRPPHVIKAVAERLRADLVAVGTTGRTGLPYILLGSVGEHVLREVKSDVLLVRSGPAHFELP